MKRTLACFLFISAFGAIAFADDLSKPIFDVHPADYCKSTEHGQADGDFKVDKGDGHNALGGFAWGQGGGCIMRPIRDVWGVTHNQPAMVWGGVSESSVETLAALPGSTHVYEVLYTVHDFITVHWVMDWVHALLDGTMAAPKRVLVNYRKLSNVPKNKNNRFMPYWEGTIELQELAPAITAFAMRNQVNAAQTDSNDAAGAVKDVFDHLSKEAPNLGPISKP